MMIKRMTLSFTSISKNAKWLVQFLLLPALASFFYIVSKSLALHGYWKTGHPSTTIPG